MKSIIASLLFLSKSTFSSGGGWDYDHMDGWAHDFEMCDASDESPINILSDELIYDSSVCTSTFNWTIDWSIHKFKIHNNGHSISLTPVRETSIDPDGDIEETLISDDDEEQYMTLTLNENSIARLPNYFLPYGSDHEEFCLHSFHFHWGLENDEGSEHLIDDIQYPLEVHFVHYSCAHASLGTTLGQYETEDDVLDARENGFDTHELAVVGIMFELTDYDNPVFDAMLSEDTLDYIKYPSDVSGYVPEQVVDNIYLQDIIPDNVFTDGYFAYEGSLTTPPCTNIVRWHVMNAKSYISKIQLNRFRELMMTANQTMAPNYRDVQNNINPVYACFEKYVEPDIVTAAERTERAIVWVWAVFVFGLMIGLGVICTIRSKREQNNMIMAEPMDAKRQRLASKSSIGSLHDNMKRQQSMSQHRQQSMSHRQSFDAKTPTGRQQSMSHRASYDARDSHH